MGIIKKILIVLVVLIAILFVVYKCLPVNPPPLIFKHDYKGDLPLDKIELPPGFKIDVYVEDLENARSMELSPNGTLFVGTRSKGNVYALKDTNNDYRVDLKYLLMEDGNMPNGVAFKDGDLYVAEVNRILRFKDIENNLSNPGIPEVFYDGYPSDTHHGWKYIAFGPDGNLYVPVGAPCNICDSENQVYASITRLNSTGTEMKIIQRGIRNTVGFTWHPKTGELWFTDNGRDWLGDEIPACELNHAPRENMHFGYPYCHQGDLPDPEFGKKFPCSDFEAPVQNLGPHTAPLGLEFYTGSNFPKNYTNQIFIAEHGSWNRSTKIGYQISLVELDGNKSRSYKAFAKGWLNTKKDEVWGRPVDIELLPDGSMLVSDDFANAIYRIYFAGI